MINFRFDFLQRFDKSFKKLDPDSQSIIRNSLRTLAEDPRHPVLHTHRVKGKKDVWESRANRDLRITWEYSEGSVIVLRNCGHHGETLDNP